MYLKHVKNITSAEVVFFVNEVEAMPGSTQASVFETIVRLSVQYLVKEIEKP